MVFLDTNVLNYALLSQDEQKRKLALEILVQALAGEDFVISTQVLSECANVLFKKGNMDGKMVSQCMGHLQRIRNIVPVTVQLVNRAIEIKALYDLQFYDAQIVAAAEKAECSEIWSEDLGDGQLYCGIQCVNPFV
ncbi:MAG: PIN domain-containing protein [Victivallales bacterium]|nr:PIN domain-containing protein [Victivallales bacterium]